MNKNNKVLLFAFIIIIGAFISSSIEGITGRVVDKKITKVSVSPYKTYPGEELYVTVIPGEEGVNEEAVFYNSNGKLNSHNLCFGSYKCVEPITFNFMIPDNWKSGVYQVKVYDYALKDFIKGDFTIKEVR